MSETHEQGPNREGTGTHTIASQPSSSGSAVHGPLFLAPFLALGGFPTLSICPHSAPTPRHPASAVPVTEFPWFLSWRVPGRSYEPIFQMGKTEPQHPEVGLTCVCRDCLL